MDFKGEVIWIGDARKISDKFTVRRIAVKELSGNYPQELQMQAVNDRVKILDGIKVGDVVELGINLKGNRATNPDKNGDPQWFTNIEIWKIQVAGPKTGEPRDYTTAFEGAPF
jgi:hypothetical protein